jgi:uncharacterized protein (TIGR00369 family)
MSSERTSTAPGHDSLATPGAAAGRSGIAFLQGILDGATPPAPIQSTLGFDLIDVREGAARFRLSPGEHLYNPMNAVHGGVACVLLDSAMGSAAMTTLDEKTAYTTVDLTVHLTRAIQASTGPITAEGRVLHRGQRVVVTEGRLTDEQGRLLAHATGTCLLFERPVGRPGS